jgi:Na+/proline symporter
MLTKRANAVGAVIGALIGFVCAIWSWHHVTFIWYAVIGCLPTFVFGYGISLCTTSLSENNGLVEWSDERSET